MRLDAWCESCIDHFNSFKFNITDDPDGTYEADHFGDEILSFLHHHHASYWADDLFPLCMSLGRYTEALRAFEYIIESGQALDKIFTNGNKYGIDFDWVADTIRRKCFQGHFTHESWAKNIDAMVQVIRLLEKHCPEYHDLVYVVDSCILYLMRTDIKYERNYLPTFFERLGPEFCQTMNLTTRTTQDGIVYEFYFEEYLYFDESKIQRDISINVLGKDDYLGACASCLCDACVECDVSRTVCEACADDKCNCRPDHRKFIQTLMLFKKYGVVYERKV